MPKRTTSQAKGRLGELEFTLALESQGIACVDMTAQDFGLDIVATLPSRALSVRAMSAIRRGEGSRSSWEMSAMQVRFQVKHVEKRVLTTEHLEMWSAANVRHPGSCFVVFVEQKAFRVLDPVDIRELFQEARDRDLKSVTVDGARGTQFERSGYGSGLGRLLSCWGHLGELLIEMPIFRKALAENGRLSVDDAALLIEDLVLLDHLESDQLVGYEEGGRFWALEREVGGLAELLAPICSGLQTRVDDYEFLEGLSLTILRDNTKEGSAAYGRYNRVLPSRAAPVMRGYIKEYTEHVADW